MAGQKEKFHLFSCRRTAIVRPVKYLTVGGLELNLVLTPSLGTPGWKRVETDFNKKNSHWARSNRMFFYVKTEPSGVDDKASIKDIQDKFGTEFVRIVVCYFQKSGTSSDLRIDVDTGNYPFHLDSSFETQKEQSQELLEQLVHKEIQSPKSSQVGSDISFPKSVTKQRHEQQHQEAIDIASSVDVPDPVDLADNVPLKAKKVSQKERQLFERTLRLGTARSNHLRVNVVGNHGVGKTTLIKRLLQQEVNCDKPDHACTENLEVHHLIARCMEREGEKVWEHGSSDTFLDDLNIQRMAQAMIETEKGQKPTATTSVAKTPKVEVENNGGKEVERSPKPTSTTNVIQSIEVKKNEAKEIEKWQTPSSDQSPEFKAEKIGGEGTEHSIKSSSTLNAALSLEVEAEKTEGKEVEKCPSSTSTTNVAQSLEVEAEINKERTVKSFPTSLANELKFEEGKDTEKFQKPSSTTNVAQSFEVDAENNGGKEAEICPKPSSTANIAQSPEVEAEKNTGKKTEHCPKSTSTTNAVLIPSVEAEKTGEKEAKECQKHSPTTNAAHSLELGSEEFFDDSSLDTQQNTDTQGITPFDNLTALEEKEDYLRKVLYCKEQLEKGNYERQYVSYWDFAGQSAYYATHQLFMSPSAIYLVVIDLSKDLDDKVTDNLEFRSGILQSCTVKEALKYWIHTVQAYTKDENDAHAPIIIVGTHKSYATEKDNYLRKFSDIRQLFKANFECVAVENSIELQKDQDLRILRSKIIDNGLGVIDKKVSTQWINLEYDMQLSCDKNRDMYLKFSDIQRLDRQMDIPMGNNSRLEAFLYHQHYKGKVLYYNHHDLKDLVITDPMLLVKYLNLLLRRTEQDAVSILGWNENGILNQSFLQTIADKIEADKHTSMIMVKILVKLNILHPLPSETADKFFLPCLLPDIPKDFHNEDEDEECTRSSPFQISFVSGSIYQTTYHQIICTLLKKLPLIEENNEKLIYNLGANFDLEENEFRWLTFYWEESKLYFYVRDFEKGKEKAMNHYVDEVMELLKNAIEDVLTTNQHGNVEYSFHVECPKHKRSFLSLDKLMKEDKVMCHGIKSVGRGITRKRHKVTTSDISSVTESQIEIKEENPTMKEKPSDRLLARLAWKLKMLHKTPNELAVLLKMQGAFVKADIATRDNNEPGTDLLSILRSWRNQLRASTTSKLLDLLCKRDCFDRRSLEQAMFYQAKTDTRFDNIPNDATDDVIISDHLGDGLTFVLIELGVRIEEVAQERRNHFDDTKAMTRELLHRWRCRETEKATTKTVLEAMRMFDLPLDPILKALNSATCTQ